MCPTLPVVIVEHGRRGTPYLFCGEDASCWRAACAWDVALESQAIDAGNENENVHADAATVIPRRAIADVLRPVMIQRAIPAPQPIPKTTNVGMTNDPPGLGRTQPR